MVIFRYCGACSRQELSDIQQWGIGNVAGLVHPDKQATQSKQ